MKEMWESGSEHPGIEVVYRGPLGIVTVVHPKYVSLFLKEPKSHDYNLLLPWLGEGLLISEGKKWFRNRRLLTPAFHYSVLKNYVSIYNSYVSSVIDKWHKSTEHGEAVQMFRAISSMSLNIILQCAFSFKSNCQQEKNQHPYILACSQLARHCSDRITNPLYAIDWIYWYTSHGRRMKDLCKVVHDHAEKSYL